MATVSINGSYWETTASNFPPIVSPTLPRLPHDFSLVYQTRDGRGTHVE